MKMTDQLLTPREAAAYCRLSISHLANKRVQGGGPDFIKIGMKVLYRQADLDDWLFSHRVNRNNPESKTNRSEPSYTTRRESGR